MPPKPYKNSVLKACSSSGVSYHGGNPILDVSILNIRVNGWTRPDFGGKCDNQLSTNAKCVDLCVSAVDGLYKGATPEEREVLEALCTDLSTDPHKSMIILEPSTVRGENGHPQETYDFGTQSISICPLQFQYGQKPVVTPKQDFLRFFAHEAAHGLDYKYSKMKRSHRPDPCKTESYEAFFKAAAPVPKHKLEDHLNCLADLVDATGVLKRDYLHANKFAQSPNDPKLATIPTEFVAFALENAFTNIHKPADFRARLEIRLQSYDPATIKWAQQTFHAMNAEFTLRLPQAAKKHLQPVYAHIEDPALQKPKSLAPKKQVQAASAAKGGGGSAQKAPRLYSDQTNSQKPFSPDAFKESHTSSSSKLSTPPPKTPALAKKPTSDRNIRS